MKIQSKCKTMAQLLLPILIVLGGCEAPLDIEQIAAKKADPMRRSDLYQAISVQGKDVVVVGRDSTLLHSRDGGQSWQRHEFSGFHSFIDVTSCPDGSFVALDTEAGVWISADRGSNWQRQPLKTDETVQAVTCSPDGRLWVVGSFTTIFQSPDLGKTWSSHSFDIDAILNGIQFFDDRQGVAVGEFGTFLTTKDGGENWSQDYSMPDEFYPEGMHFTDPKHGWVVGLGGMVLHTGDGGATWDKQSTGTQVTLYGICVINDIPYIVGREGLVMKRQGGTWKKVAHENPARLYLRAISGLGDGRLIVGGQAGALILIDTGDQTGITTDATAPGA